MKKMPKKDENESIPDDPSYRVVSVSLPRPDRRTEDLTASSTPYYRQHNIMTPKMQSQGIISATLDQNHHRLLSFPQGKQASISLVGIEAMTQTDDATLAEEPTGKARDDARWKSLRENIRRKVKITIKRIVRDSFTF